MLNDLNLDSLRLTQEQILNIENGASGNQSGASHSMDVEVQNDFEFAQLRAAEIKRAQDQKFRHTEEEHDLRKKHLDFLKQITIFWLILISIISVLQGFAGVMPIEIHLNPIERAKLPLTVEPTEFKLSDAAYIALITTTTATILGLYTIAAIWLYKGKQEDKKQKADTENSSGE